MFKSQSHRQQRATSVFLPILVEILRNGKTLDPKLTHCPVVITNVIFSADLKIANCYFVPFNTNLKVEELEKTLNKAKNSIRYLATQQITFKYSPELRFFHDKGYDNVCEVDNILRQHHLTNEKL